VPDRSWWKHGVIYQIYPRSFADADGDGVGDLRGIASRLDHLNDGTEASLGVEAVWLSPFYPSPMADFGYDVSDYTGVHPLFGTMDDFDLLVAEAHRRGIRVIIDWVPNHTSDRHPWFLASRSSRDDPKRDWYVWRDSGPDGGPPNNWQSAFERVGRAWTWDPTTEQWYLHSFMGEQPDLNWDNPEVERAMHDTLRFWLDRGVDGFRIDVTHRLGKDPELRDNPPDIVAGRPEGAARRQDEDWPTGHERLRRIRRVVEEYPDRMIVGEVYILDQERLVQYVNSGDELHLAHNFVFLHLPWGAGAFRDAVDEWERLASAEAWPVWFLSNHDHSRVVSRYDDGGHGLARARVAAMCVLTLRGTASLYQGEELGLPDVPVPPELEVDVDGRDPERCPVPWEPPSRAGPGAGFTTGTPWLPTSPEAEDLAAAVQAGDPDSTLSFYRRLIHHRQRSHALVHGSYEALDAGEDVFSYVRAAEAERVLVALNFASEARPLGLADAARSPGGRLDLSTHRERTPGPVDLESLVLWPDEGVVVRLG
jgi:alpha-glucosidase